MLIVPCPGCGARNRVDPARAAGAQCSKCHTPLLPGRPVAVDEQSFGGLLSGPTPMVVDFWAPWCGPCRTMAPAFEQAAAMVPTVLFAKVDTQAQPNLGGRFGIQSIPTMVFFAGGREIARTSGAMPAERIAAWVRQQLG